MVLGMIGKHILCIFSHVNGLLEFSHTEESEPPHRDLSIAHIFIFLGRYFGIPPNFEVQKPLNDLL